MRPPGAPADDEIERLLGEALGTNDVEIVARRPYEYATSAPLEEVRVSVDGNDASPMILKELGRGRLLPAARDAKPAFLHEPRRAIEAQRLVAAAGLGPKVHVIREPGGDDGAWILMEKIPGVELWQVGDPELWYEAARWLGRFHRRFEGEVQHVRETCPHLLDHRPEALEKWAVRARGALDASTDPRARYVMQLLDGYGDVMAALGTNRATLLHGEFFPSNILVTDRPGDARICPVDWEMAAIGPGAMDLAALSLGWDDHHHIRFLEAYRADRHDGGPALGLDALAEDLERCRLHLAVQWLGWSDGWVPPAEHRRDWIAEALDAGRRLAL